MFALLAIAVTASMTAVDFAHARYVRALLERRGPVAAAWSVAQWAAASVGFVLAVRVTMWLLPFEGVGLGLGTWLGARTRT